MMTILTYSILSVVAILAGYCAYRLRTIATNQKNKPSEKSDTVVQLSPQEILAVREAIQESQDARRKLKTLTETVEDIARKAERYELKTAELEEYIARSMNRMAARYSKIAKHEEKEELQEKLEEQLQDEKQLPISFPQNGRPRLVRQKGAY